MYSRYKREAVVVVLVLFLEKSYWNPLAIVKSFYDVSMVLLQFFLEVFHVSSCVRHFSYCFLSFLH